MLALANMAMSDSVSPSPKGEGAEPARPPLNPPLEAARPCPQTLEIKRRPEKLGRRWLKDGCDGRQAMMMTQSIDAYGMRRQTTVHFQ